MLLKTKLKNQVSKLGNYEYDLKNIIINGQKTGCSGFITNPQNNVALYINTEKSVYHPLSNKNLVRFAKDGRDYGGSHSRNTYAEDDKIASHIHKMLNDTESYKEWKETGRGGRYDFI